LTLFSFTLSLLSRLPAWAAAAIALAPFAGCGCPAGANEAACVLVRVADPEGSAGSGTVVACEAGRSLVVTNRHVVPSARYGVRVECQGKLYPVTFHAAHPAADLAILVVPAELPCAEVADAEPAPGAEVRQWGRAWYGQGRPVPKAGRWVGIDRFRVRGTAIARTTLDNHSGDSGAGVFHAGKVVAVTWGVRGHSVCLADLRAFLRDRAAALFPRLAERLSKPAEKPAEKPAAKEKAPGPKRAAAAKPSVTVYTRTDPPCPACMRLQAVMADPRVKALLDRCDLKIVDVSSDPSAVVRSVPYTRVEPPAGSGKYPASFVGSVRPEYAVRVLEYMLSPPEAAK
jgi:hypothetical protein